MSNSAAIPERQREEMSMGVSCTGATADDLQLLHSGRIVGGPPLGLGHTQSSLVTDNSGNRAAGATASPMMSRRSPSAGSLIGRSPSAGSLLGCRVHPPQMQEWLDAKSSPKQDRVQDPLSDRQSPEAFLLTPRMGGGMQPWTMQSPNWEECPTPGTVSPVKAGQEATRSSFPGLAGAASPRQAPVPQLCSPQRIPASALAKWEAKQSPKAAAGGGSVAGLTQQHLAETSPFGKSSSGRPPPKTVAAMEKGRDRSASPDVSLDQQVPYVLGRQNWPPRPPGCSSPGHSPVQVKSPQKIPASALAPWQGQQGSPKLSSPYTRPEA